MNDKVATNIKMDVELKKKAQKKAIDENTTLSDLVNTALKQFLEREEK